MDTIDWVSLGLLALHVLLALAAAVYVSMNRNPSSAIAWVMAVVFIPLLGILFFLLVGAGRLPKSRREAQREVSDDILERTEGGLDQLWSNRDKWPDWLPSITVLNRNLGALPMIGGNTATLNGDYLKTIKAIADDIDLAREYVHIEYFILVYDDTTEPVFDALRRARERGVTVRVLSDHMAQFAYPNRKETVKMLTGMGAQYYPMLPIRPLKGQLRRIDMRNHPQDRCDRRADRSRRLAESDCRQLPPEEEHRARPALARAGCPLRGADRPRAGRCVPHRLVQRVR